MVNIRSTSTAREMRAPRERVWRVMTDLDRRRHAGGHVLDFEVLSTGPFGEGTRWRETRRIGRRTAVLAMTVESALAPEGYVATGTIDATEGRLSYHLVEHGPERTEVIGTLEYAAPDPGSAARRVWAMVFGTPEERLLRRELGDRLVHVERAVREEQQRS
jgi:hypothetical protein